MYYPKSQIKSNLYTNGGEYILSTTQQEYIGYYFETSTGQKYTGKSPNDLPNILLNNFRATVNSQPNNFDNNINGVSIDLLNSPLDIPTVSPDEDAIKYNSISNISISDYPQFNKYKSRLIPKYSPVLPTPQDQQKGFFVRYFCKKNNELKYIEIDKTSYTLLYEQSSTIAWDLYTPISLKWQLIGNKNQVYNFNKAITVSIEKKYLWYGFSQYFQDKFLKYYLES